MKLLISNKAWLTVILLCYVNATGCLNTSIKKNTETEQQPLDSDSKFLNTQKEAVKITNIIALQKAQKWSEANQKWNDLIKSNIESPNIYINLAITYNKLDDTNGAKKSLEKAIELAPNNYYAWQQLGIVERKLGNFKSSEKSYIKALKIEPSDYISHINIGILYDLYLGKPQKAIDHFERAKESSGKAEKIVTPWLKELKIRAKNEK